MSAAPATIPATLYQIEDELLIALDTIEMIPEDEPGLRTELEEHIARLVASEIGKVDGVARMLAHFETQASLAAEEIKRLQARKKSFERNYERLESCAKLAMEISGKKKLEGATSSLSLQKNPPAVFVSNFDAIPPEYLIAEVHTSVDKPAVKRAIQSGAIVPGAELVQGERLVRR